MHYLDTSVLVAYYCPERLSEKVQKALGSLGEPTISPLVELEFHSALSLKVRTGVLGLPAANKIAAMFQLHINDARYRLVPVGAREYAIARQWVGGFTSTLRALDALHLAATFANNMTLISADELLIRAAGQFGVKHLLIS
ncbi:MAG: type II toxin-antitoxin system VapC family toxin [Phycisphaeraceae bacterium]